MFSGCHFSRGPPLAVNTRVLLLANLFPYIFVSVFFSLGGVKNFAQNLITLSYLLHIVYSQMTYMNFWGEWGDGGGIK